MLRDSIRCLAWSRRGSVAARRLAFALLACGWCALPAAAQLPAPILNSIFPAGGQKGTKIEVTLSGLEIEDATQLQFTHSGLTAAPKTPADPSAKPGSAKFSVNVAPDVPAGLYEVRVVTPYGISNPRAFQVGSLPEINETEPNNKLAASNDVALNSVVNGTTDAEGVDCFRFSAKQGQRVLLDCWGQRIDSKTDATMILYDAKGSELDRSLDVHGRDPFIDFTVPSDGQYVVEVHDFLYKGGPDYFYRLSLSTAPYIDFIYPCAGEPGKKSKFTLYGRNLPSGTPDPAVAVGGRVLDKLEVEIELPHDPLECQRMPVNGYVEPRDAYQDAFAYRLTTPQGESNSANIFFAAAPVVLEQEPDNNDPAKAQKLTIPCEAVGQFNPKQDQDWYTFDAKKGDVLWLEVISQRLGLKTDPYMMIQRVKLDAQGKEQISDVVEVDDYIPEREKNQQPAPFDVATDDPIHKLTVTEDATYRVLLKDLYAGSRGSPLAAYRFSIRPETPDFRLLTVAQGPFDDKNPQQVRVGSPIVFKGGATGIKVLANRRDGFDGEIRLALEGLPEGLSCGGAVLGPKMNTALLVVSAAENVAAWSGPVKIVGKAKIKDQKVVREARSAAMLWGIQNPQEEVLRTRMTQIVSLGVNTVDESPAMIQLGDAKPLEVKIGDKLTIPIKVTRRGEFKGSLKLKAVGLPKDLIPGELDIAATAADGSITFEAKPMTPPGTYTFIVQASSPINYRKNPKAAEKALEAQKLADKGALDAAAAAKAAADRVPAAVKAVADAETAAKVASDQLPLQAAAVAGAETALKLANEQLQAKTNELAAADGALQAVADSLAAKAKEIADGEQGLKVALEHWLAVAKENADLESAMNAAAEHLKVAADAEAQKPEDQERKDAHHAAEQAFNEAQEKRKHAAEAKAAAEKVALELQAKQKPISDAVLAMRTTHAEALGKQKQLASAVTSAEKALADSLEKQKQAVAAKATGEKALSDAKAKQQAAADAKVAADKSAADAQAKLKAAEAEKVAAAQRAKDIAEAAKPKNMNMNFVSTPVTVTILAK